MGDFEVKERWKVYLDKPTKEKLHEIKEHLEENYEGPSDFVQKKIQEEEVLDIDQRIERAKQKEERHRNERKKLEQIKSEREEASKLRDKRELLKEKQKQLRKISDKGIKSEEEIRQEQVQHFREKAMNSGKVDDVDEHMNKERVQNMIDRRVKKKASSNPDVDELVESVERLQSEVAELNGGREEYFMDIEAEEVTA